MIEIFSLGKYISTHGLEDMLFLEKKTWDRYKNFYGTSFWTEKEFLYNLKDKFRLSKVILLKNKLVGFSIMYTFKENYAHISRLAIDYEVQNKGYASKILLLQINELKDINYEYLSIDLVAENSAAKKVYSKIGFEELSGKQVSDYVKFKNRNKSEYLDGLPSHIAMIKKL